MFRSEEPEIADEHFELAQLKDCPKDQGDKLIEINLVEEGKEVLAIFLTSTLLS